MTISEVIRNAYRDLKVMVRAAWGRKFLNNFKHDSESITVSEIRDFSWIKWFKGEYNVRMQNDIDVFRGILVGTGSFVFGMQVALFMIGPFFCMLTAIPATALGMTFSLFGTAIDLKFQAQ